MAYAGMKIGDSGESVKTLKQLLKGAGYTLTDDDLFDEDTYKAVKEYQSANGLNADGEAGASTWAKLAGSVVSSVPKGAGTKESVSYLESNRPKAYASDYTQRIDDLVNTILTREDFSYDPSSDPMYQKYKDTYMYLGKRAMNDAVGAASALSGGYVNSFAQTQGQQAYQDYLAQLTGGIPEMYALALEAYDAKTGQMQSALKALTDSEQRAYDRYLDDLDEYNKALSYYYDKLQDEQAQSNWEKKNAPKKSSSSSSASKPREEETLSNILTPSEFLKRKVAGSKELSAYATYRDYSEAMKKKYS